MNDSYKKEYQWSRELLLAFYLPFFLICLLTRLRPDSHKIYLLYRVIYIISMPGLIFSIGYLAGITHTDKKEKFQNACLKLALVFFTGFMVTATWITYHFKGENLLNVIRDTIAFINMPVCSNILFTLTLFALTCAFFWKNMDALTSSPLMLGIVCLLGLACLYIPKDLIGYGLIGSFVGGDSTGAVPMAYYLIAFFWGIYCAKKSTHLINKASIILFLLCILGGGAFYVIGHSHTTQVLLGIAAAYAATVFGRLFLPLYSLIEKLVLSIWALMTGACKRCNELAKTRKSVDFLVYLILYTGLFLIVLYLCFFPYLENGRTLIWSADGLGQYIPKAHRFISYIPHIFQQMLQGNWDFQQYDFTTGLGSTVSISFDPIYWLYLLFNESQIETAYSFLILLRFFLAGLSMSALLRYFKKSRYAALLGSMAYTFSGFAIYAGTRHGQFLNPLILLPILVIAMEQLIRKKRWYLLSVLVAVSLLCSYYFLYMNTIALGIYFVSRILCTKEYRNFKTFFTRGLIITGSYIIGACIGSISLFTSFGSYLGSARSSVGNTSEFLSTTALFYREDWIATAFSAFLSDTYAPGLWLKFGFPPLALFAIILLFTRKDRKELKIFFILFSLFCIFPIFGFMFSGFSVVNNRWAYIYAFVICFILAHFLESFERLTPKEMYIMTGLTAVYGFFVCYAEKVKPELLTAFGFLGLTLGILMLINNDKLSIRQTSKRTLLFVVTIAVIVVNANIFITSGGDEKKENHLGTYTEKGTSYDTVTNTALKYLDQVENKGDEFYRATNLKTRGSNRSGSMILGFNDLSIFTSTLPGGIVDYNRMMGNCDWNIVTIYSYNARTIMNGLAGVKYIGQNALEDKVCIPFGYKRVLADAGEEKNLNIYENEYALPLGYTYSDVVSYTDALAYSETERQETTLLAAIVDDDDMEYEKKANIHTTSISELPLTVHQLPIDKFIYVGCHKKGNKIIVDEPGATMQMKFKGEPNAETYISFAGDIFHKPDSREHNLKAQVHTKGVSYEYKFRMDAYNTSQDAFLFNLGYHEDAINSCKLTFKNAGKLQLDEILLYCQNMDLYPERIKALKENSLTNVVVDNNTVTGDITVDGNKLLVITLPYQTGWTAYVDGKKVDIIRANYQYMGINLSEGSHSIRLHYQLPGLKIALYMTLGGLAVFFLLILVIELYRRKKAKASAK